MSPYNLYNDGIDESSSHINTSTKNVWDGSYMMPKRDPLYIVVPMTIMYSVIFVTGVIGNSITCLVIAKHKYMHTATNYYLFSLAVSDLILLVSGLPQEMWSIWSRYPYIFGEIFCQLRGLFAEMSANATVLTITAFTAERYVAICHPFMAQSMSKLSRAVKLIAVIWLVAVLFAIPQALQFTVSSWNGNPEVEQCNIRNIPLMDTNIELSTVSFTLSTVLFFVMPMTFITVLYVLIGLRLRSTDKLKRTMTIRSTNGEKKSSSPEYRANSSSKVLKMLVAVVVAFFICWAPFHAQRLIAIFGSSHASSGNVNAEDIPFLHQLYGISTYVSGVLYYMSTTVNPILYHTMSLKFRAAFKETVLRCCGGSGDGDRWSGGGSVRRQQQWNWERVRRRSDSSAAPGDGRRQKYRRVSGRTSLSTEFPPVGPQRCRDGVGVAAVPAAAPLDGHRRLSAVCLAGRWCRALKASTGGHGCGCGSAARRENTDCTDGGGGGRRLTPSSPVYLFCGQRKAASEVLSDWTMISNSSLKDVDGEDLRDELDGYADPKTTPLNRDSAAVANEYY